MTPVIVAGATAASRSLHCHSVSWFMLGDTGAERLKTCLYKPLPHHCRGTCSHNHAMLQGRKKMLGRGSWRLLCMHRAGWLHEGMSTCCRHYLRCKTWSLAQWAKLSPKRWGGEARCLSVAPDSHPCSPDRWDIKIFSSSWWPELGFSWALGWWAWDRRCKGQSSHSPCRVLHGSKLLPNQKPLQTLAPLLNF